MFASDHLEGQIAGLMPANTFVMLCDAWPGETGTGGVDLTSARAQFEMAALVP